MIDRARWRDELRSRLIPETRAWGLSVGDGWRDLVCDLVDHIETTNGRISMFQIKEKFGGLRFYPEQDPDATISALIDEAENASWSICDGCGAKGSERMSVGWTRVVCEPCFKKWDEDSWSGNPRVKE